MHRLRKAALHLTFGLPLLFLGLTSAAYSQDDCESGDKLSNDEIQGAFDEAKDRLKERHYNDPESEKNNQTFYEVFVKDKIKIGRRKGLPIAGTIVDKSTIGGVDIERLRLVVVNQAGVEELDPCLGKCPDALGKMFDLILEHEFHNMPESSGGSGYEDSPNDDPKTKEDESDAQTPIGEVANTYASMKEACEKAGEQGADQCTKSSMCALYKKLKEQFEGKGSESHNDPAPAGSAAEENKAGFADEIKKHEDSGDPDPTEFGSDPLPPAGENPEGDCEVEIGPCPACEGEGGDSGTEGDGAASSGGGEPGSGTGG